MEDTITTGIDFLTKIQSGHFVLLKFTKKDGSTRLMKATLNFDLVPKEKKPKESVTCVTSVGYYLLSPSIGFLR